MTRLFAGLVVLLPAIATAQTPLDVITFVETHCVRSAPAGAFYDLPDGWKRADRSATRFWLPSIAVEEGIDYAAFITHQIEVSKEVDAERGWPLTVEAYEDQLSDERSYTRSDWQRLYVHRDSNTHLFIGAGEDTDNPDDWFPPRCYLWHPDADNPLAAAITARWDVPFGDRLVTGLGQATFAWNKVVVEGGEMTLESRVIRPYTDFAEGLAPVILKLELR
ncbi:MAG: hypothetical protein AAFV19_14330 [Pseudomonadota bacterium]